MEQELKYSLEGKVASSPSFLPAGSPSIVRRFVAYYLDSEQQELANLGAGFRLRLEGKAWVLTLKWESELPARSQALSQRHEWNQSLEAQEAEKFIRNPMALRVYLQEQDRPAQCPDFLWSVLVNKVLTPQFMSEFERCSREFRYGESRFEEAIDLGYLRASGQAESIAELEYELLEGRLLDLEKLAQVMEEKGYKAEPRSKLSRLLALERATR